MITGMESSDLPESATCSKCGGTGWCCADEPDAHRCRCGAVPVPPGGTVPRGIDAHSRPPVLAWHHALAKGPCGSGRFPFREGDAVSLRELVDAYLRECAGWREHPEYAGTYSQWEDLLAT